MAISCNQRESVNQKKTDAVWLDGGTSPSVCTLNELVCFRISTSLIISIHENISNKNFASTYFLVPLPPVPGTMVSIPPIVTTDFNSSGQPFIWIGIFKHPHSYSSYISFVRINGNQYQRPIFEANGQQINGLINHIVQVIIFLILWNILMHLIYFNTTFANPRTFSSHPKDHHITQGTSTNPP